MIDNGAALGHNLWFLSSEAIHTTSAGAAVAVVRCYRKKLDRRLQHRWKLRAGSCDMWKAYRQVPLDIGMERFHVVRVWDIVHQRFRYVIARVLLLGFAGSVINYNRVPAFIVAVARRWRAILAQHFYDDKRIISAAIGGDSAYDSFLELTELMGLRFDPAKHQRPCADLPLLGNIEKYSTIPARDEMVVAAKEERVSAVTELIRVILMRKTISCGEAASLRGKLLNLSQTLPGKVGRPTLVHLNAVANSSQNRNWTEGLDWDLRFALWTLSLKHERVYSLKVRAKWSRAWTDASFHKKGASFVMKICASGDKRNQTWCRDYG